MRYFIIFYAAVNSGGKSVESFSIVEKEKGYFNFKEFCSGIEEERKLKYISLRNIVELNESDYNDFIKEQNEK